MTLEMVYFITDLKIVKQKDTQIRYSQTRLLNTGDNTSCKSKSPPDSYENSVQDVRSLLTQTELQSLLYSCTLPHTIYSYSCW